MSEDEFREHVCAWLKAMSEALIDHTRTLETLALAVQKQGRQGTLRIKVEAPTTKRRRKARVRS